MAKKRSQDLTEDFSTEPESGAALELETVEPEPGQPEPAEELPPVGPESHLDFLLRLIDAGRSPIALACGHSREARRLLMELDAAAGERPRTLSLDRMRLGVAGVEVFGCPQTYHVRGKRWAAAYVAPVASAKMIDLVRRAVKGEIFS